MQNIDNHSHQQPSPNLLAIFAISSTLLLSLLLPSKSLAETLPNFQAVYSVHAFGATLGKARHSYKCINGDCTLISRAKPEGFAALFIKDSSVEVIKLKQDDQSFNWQSYHKVGISEKDGKTSKKRVTLIRNEENDTIEFTEGERHWPSHPHTYDIMSIAYAVQWHALKQTDFRQLVLYLQDNNFQEQLSFTLIAKDDDLSLPFEFEELRVQQYRLETKNYQIDLWLMPQKRYFPGKIRLINRAEDRTITLQLAEPVKTL